ncbi:hypothetical protein [Brevibacterium litoralis]|uniref:hypothetical protein n=1 Tax=Brevibacterium litoralis TaxID=3138935 RepID=UPI0032EAE409
MGSGPLVFGPGGHNLHAAPEPQESPAPASPASGAYRQGPGDASTFPSDARPVEDPSAAEAATWTNVVPTLDVESDSSTTLPPAYYERQEAAKNPTANVVPGVEADADDTAETRVMDLGGTSGSGPAAEANPQEQEKAPSARQAARTAEWGFDARPHSPVYLAFLFLVVGAAVGVTLAFGINLDVSGKSTYEMGDGALEAVLLFVPPVLGIGVGIGLAKLLNARLAKALGRVTTYDAAVGLHRKYAMHRAGPVAQFFGTLWAAVVLLLAALVYLLVLGLVFSFFSADTVPVLFRWMVWGLVGLCVVFVLNRIVRIRASRLRDNAHRKAAALQYSFDF